MDADLWRRVERVLDVALTREPAAWPALLEDTCGDDPEVRREVEALLERLTTARSLLGEDPRDLAESLLSDARVRPASYEGRRIGAYRLVREIGRGGMSHVFLAERADGEFEQQVALKLLRPGLDSEVDQSRFRSERQILASLKHPNIAVLLDGGVTGDGMPYLVMELIDGIPLDRYCRERRLPLRQRLQLFTAVCEATQYAHRNLVVHRDLKPGNILVTATGEVKLLDFGLARLISSSAAAEPVTRFGHRWLTPEYAAPEQVAGGTINTLTDVYQLGAVLYQLICDALPFEAHADASPAALERAILNEEPPAPSSVLARCSPQDAGVVRGDLDAIVLRALRKEPDERYASPEALAGDLQRYLEGRPVQARAAGRLYRVWKFTRRNRGRVGASAVMLGLLLGSTAFSVEQRREAEAQRDLAVREALRQQARAEVLRAVASELRGPGGEPMSAGQRIELAAGLVTRRYADDPWLVVDLLDELAAQAFEVGENELSRHIHATSASIASDAGLDAELAEASCQLARRFAQDWVVDTAAVELERGRAALARAGASQPKVEMACLQAEGELRLAEDRAEDAVLLLERAYALSDERTPRLFRLSLLNSLGNALRAAGRTRDAIQYQTRIVVELDSTGYGTTNLLANATTFLAGAFWELGEFVTLDSIVGTLLARTGGHGPVPGTDPVLAMTHGVTKLRAEQIDSAAVWLERALSLGLPPDVRDAWAPPAMAELRLEQGKLDDARRIMTRLPEGSLRRRAQALLLTASLARAEGREAESSALLVAGLRELVGDRATPPQQLTQAYVVAAEWRVRDGDMVAADSLARSAMAAAAVDSLALTRSAYAGRAQVARAQARLAMGDTAAAAMLLERAVQALETGYGPNNPRAAAARAVLVGIRASGAPSTRKVAF